MPTLNAQEKEILYFLMPLGRSRGRKLVYNINKLKYNLNNSFLYPGSGSRKQVVIPTEVKTRPDPQPEAKGSRSPDSEDNVTKALVACGGDFTIYIDDDGKIYATGNMSKHVSICTFIIES